MSKAILSTALAIAGIAGFSGAVSAADIALLNVDPPGIGLNDNTPTLPRGDNPGRTIGEQRRITYQYAMDQWGQVLESDVQIKIYASFAPLTCSSTTGVLGQAAANWLYILNDGTRQRIYPAALADALIGTDLSVLLGDDPNDPADIFSQFNGQLGQPGCLDGLSWYYGFDGKTPQGSINFLNTVMHEIGHGLGVSGFLNKNTGALLAGYSDVYTQFAYDNVLDLGFEQMTNAQRALAMRTPGRTVWTGPSANFQAGLILDHRTALKPTSPQGLVGDEYEIGSNFFGPIATATNFTSPMVLINDGVGTATDGCEAPYVNAAAVAGKIAVIDRGACGFADKVYNAQLNGAVGVVVVNTAAGSPIDMGGSTTSGQAVTIPSVMVSLTDGNTIKANLPVTAKVELSSLLAGADAANRMKLYTPSTVAAGSTFSHVDTSLTPNALMEPFDSADVESQINVDVTPGIFADLGWTVNPDKVRIGNCSTGVDAVEDGGLIPGANIVAFSNLCAVQSNHNKLLYTRCMTTHLSKLRQMGAINNSEFSSSFRCAALNRP